jgi:hypothetical protein
MRIWAALSLSLTVSTGPALAQQGWENVGLLMQQAFQTSTEWDSGYWLPDRTNPAEAREAIGVAYPVISGAAGNTTIVTGYFVRSDDNFVYAGPVEGMFGHNPRGARFLPDRIEVITTMPLPGEPRCCPTGTARWTIDRTTRQATRIE